MPRSCSSGRRSGSIPVSVRTRLDLPWSMWPAVPTMTLAMPGAGAVMAAARARSRVASVRGAHQLGQVEDALAAAAVDQLARAVEPGEVVRRDAHLAAAAHLALGRDDHLPVARLEDALVDRERAGRQRLHELGALDRQRREVLLVAHLVLLPLLGVGFGLGLERVTL